MKGIITSVRLSTFNRQWAVVSIDHGTGIPDTQLTIPAIDSGAWTLGEEADWRIQITPTPDPDLTAEPLTREQALARLSA